MGRTIQALSNDAAHSLNRKPLLAVTANADEEFIAYDLGINPRTVEIYRQTR